MSAYARIAELIEQDRCVILDGATGTELSASDHPELEDRLWGTGALVRAPDDVLAVHRRYVDVGCDVISTDTWGLPTAVRDEQPQLWEAERPVHWMDVARRGVALARRAVADGGRTGECAVAFSLNGDVDTPEGAETIRLLARVFEDDPPDIVLLETLSLVRATTYDTVERLLGTGLPVWLSFRRCRSGVCGVYGEHWGGPEGDAFGRAARRFEQMGVSALLVNCIPPDHVGGMISWMRDFTDLPLGAYPNLGYLSTAGWRTEAGVGGAEYAQMARAWRDEGAQIVGGCCGVGPGHLASAGRRSPASPPATPGRSSWSATRRTPACCPPARGPSRGWTGAAPRSTRWTSPTSCASRASSCPRRAASSSGSTSSARASGTVCRCLDVGCGTGLLTVQLARNGADHVHAIDIDSRATQNTLTNAFRNGVADRVTAAAVDLYPWVPEERYDVIVASLYQTPVDPFEPVSTHRPLDYWGRNLIDRLIAMLPEALAERGICYLMQLSIIGQRRTAALLDRAGFRSRVVDFGFFEFSELFSEREQQIHRVEQLSDAYHLRLGDRNVIVAYLVEVTRAAESEGPPA